MAEQISLHFELERLLHRCLDRPAGLDGRLDLPLTYNCQHSFKQNGMPVSFRRHAFNLARLIEQDIDCDSVAEIGIDRLNGHARHRSAQAGVFSYSRRFPMPPSD